MPFNAARDKLFLPIFGRLHPRLNFPHVAVLAMCAITAIGSLFDLGTVINMLTAVMVLVQCIGQVFALTTLRHRQPNLRRPYRMFVRDLVLPCSIGVYPHEHLAKQRIKVSGAPFAMPTGGEWAERLRSVLHVLYLLFTEGYAASTGARVARSELSGEAIRLARMVHVSLPDDPEVAGLLALMLLNEARRPARTGPAGELVPLAEQDRSRWDRALIEEGVALVSDALPKPALQSKVHPTLAMGDGRMVVSIKTDAGVPAAAFPEVQVGALCAK